MYKRNIKKHKIKGGSFLDEIPIIKDIRENSRSIKSQDNKHYISNLIYNLYSNQEVNPHFDFRKQAAKINEFIKEANEEDPKFSERTNIHPLNIKDWFNEEASTKESEKIGKQLIQHYQDIINHTKHYLDQGKITQGEYEQIVNKNRNKIENTMNKKRSHEFKVSKDKKDVRVDEDPSKYNEFDKKYFTNNFYTAEDAVLSGLSLGLKSAFS